MNFHSLRVAVTSGSPEQSELVKRDVAGAVVDDGWTPFDFCVADSLQQGLELVSHGEADALLVVLEPGVSPMLEELRETYFARPQLPVVIYPANWLRDRSGIGNVFIELGGMPLAETLLRAARRARSGSPVTVAEPGTELPEFVEPEDAGLDSSSGLHPGSSAAEGRRLSA